ncbi:hypothetical protein Ddye_024278 [Dipteronia dyeriana]|uniref:Transposase MuDR plant domain-containing protein n=1 Tax=Dipteronia dyeriana TaxID=168575 RepID=A0AAD9TUI4_9ROSI|nr:hypothetical protein Ddye_024278 [Dipteronia dyeriana]
MLHLRAYIANIPHVDQFHGFGSRVARSHEIGLRLNGDPIGSLLTRKPISRLWVDGFGIEDDKCAICFELGEGGENGKVSTVYIDKVYSVIGIDINHYRVTLTTVVQTFRPSLPIEIIDDNDNVALLLRRDPLVCISVEQIDDDHPEGFTETANNGNSSHRHFGFHDTIENENVYVHEVSEPQFDPIFDQVPIWSDNQFTHIQRLVPPPSASYSINFGEVAPKPVDICIATGELFESKQQLQSQLGRYAFANRFQIRVMKSDPTRYQVRCIVEECKWRLRAVKIRRFDHEHTCTNEARFPHQRQASARVIGEHIKGKFSYHR